MRAGFVQYNPEYLAVDDNLNAVESLLTGVDADLLVLPELFASGYFFRSREDLSSVAEPVPGGKTVRRLEQWAAEMGATLAAGIPERESERFYNSAVIVTPAGYQATYRKVHLYYEEKLHFTGGDLGFRVFDAETRSGQRYRLGVMICFDWYFPESARTLAVAGADVIAHPSNLVRSHCPSAMPIRALENHVYTITANRTGEEHNGREALTFIGQSVICGPDAEVLLKAGPEETRIGVVDFDPQAARNRQITAHNHLLNDRRPDTYALS